MLSVPLNAGFFYRAFYNIFATLGNLSNNCPKENVSDRSMFQNCIKFSLLISIVLVSGFARAQRWEFGAALGASNYNGDLAREIVLKESHLAGGAFFRYNLGKFASIRPGINLGTISGSDKNFSENKYRNLSFKSTIFEISTLMEFNFKPFGAQVRTQNFSPYVAIGLAGFHFNPKATYNGDVFELRTQRTEGQSKMYKTFQISVPFGMGLKWSVTNNLTVGFEFLYRRTFTDYLDDVSKNYPDLVAQKKAYGPVSAALSDRSGEVSATGNQLSTANDMRGDPGLKDWYLFSMFSFSYRLTPIICWPNKPSVIWDY
mgnify:CR=1|jgi:hypothetical protein